MALNRIDLLLTVLALGLGFCLSRISLCAVAAARACVLHRRGTAVAGLAVAASASGLMLLLSWLCWPAQVTLPADLPITLRILSGAVLLGIGALLNGGCYLGSVSYLGTGNSNFLFTLVGIGMTSRWIGSTMHPAMGHMSAMHGLWVITAALFVFSAVLLLAWRSGRQAEQGAGLPLRGAWPWQRAAACCGVAAALLFACSPNWTYSHAVEALATLDSQPLDWRRELPAVAMFVGVGTGALLSGRFRWVRPTALRALRCLLGGSLMAFGASRIPGGNDALLLWAIPGVTLHGLVAYGVMLLTLFVSFGIGHAARGRRP